jgi:lipooligosaccharide transport system permease protein
MLPTIGAVRVWRRDFESWKRYAPAFFVVALCEPLFYLLSIGFGLGQYVAEMGGVPYAVFLAPGIIASAAMNTASFETTFGSFTRMTEQNTYAAILSTPCSVADIIAGDILWAATKSVVSAGFVLLITGALGLLPSPFAVAVLPVAFVIGIMFGSIGMVVTGRAPSYDFFSYYFTLGISVMFLFAGVFFPLDTLPAPARAIAWVLPLTHAVHISRSLAAGAPSLALLGSLAWMLVIALAAFVVAERTIRRRLLV